MRQSARLAARSILACAWLAAALPTAAAGPEPVDWQAVNRIRDEGFEHSEVMATVRHLTEEIGPRLTGSPAMKQANEWTRDQLAEWGLENARVEAWGEFGPGWSFERVSVQMIEPFAMPMLALPEAWTPGTDGPVRGEVVRVSLETEEDLEAYRGKLAGKIVMIDEERELADHTEGALQRYDEEQLAGLTEYEIPDGPWAGRAAFRKRWKVREMLPAYLVEEGVVATLKASGRDAGLIRVSGPGPRKADESPGVPGLVMAVEYYNRLARLAPEAERAEKEPEAEAADSEAPADGEVESAEAEAPPEEPAAEAEAEAEEPAKPAPVLEIDVAARFYDDDLQAYNTFADLPGGDLADQLVMVGAHLDSWHTGTGATDNAAGSAIVMEAVRILKAIGVKPRRTIRVALWSGEEQGLLGSEAWAAKHLASRPEDPKQEELPRWLRKETGPLELHELHDKVSAYFNVDNGGGKIRGIYTQGDVATVPIFEAWLEPFHDLGAHTVTNNDTGGTDHQSFDRVGVPGFQFIQDEMDYSAVTHHTNADTFDHLVREDMEQASVILASFLYHAAMRDELIPRKPLPRDPKDDE